MAQTRTPFVLLGIVAAGIAGALFLPSSAHVRRAAEPAAAQISLSETGPIRYGRDIRPILSDRCFLCHGPDRAKQQAAEKAAA